MARDLRRWLAETGAKALYIEPGSPWENSYCESFNSKLRDEFPNGEIFYSIKELRVPAERWRVHYNTVRPHSALGYRAPAPELKSSHLSMYPRPTIHISTISVCRVKPLTPIRSFFGWQHRQQKNSSGRSALSKKKL